MTPLEWLDALQGSGIRPGLGRMRAMLRALGRPERRVPAVIVAGTNGKGSTASTLASILTCAGYKTGLYTSPHLVELRERWAIDGTPISAEALESAIIEVRAATAGAGITPTYFEALTLIAFVAFASAGCEITVLEVGMGGRLDATNVVRPLAALITPIGFDHTEYLGTTLPRIAAEKAGVIHRGTIALTTNRDPRVLGVLRRRASQFGSPLHVVEAQQVELPDVLPLAGPFQRENAALAVRAAEELATLFPQIGRDAILRGVTATRWRGRLERIRIGDHDVWIDGCHNAHAIAAVVPFLVNLERPRVLVFGIMSDKDVGEVTSHLFPLFDRIVVTEPYPPRSAPVALLEQLARNLAIPVIAEPRPEAALRAALAGPERVVFVGGSLYLAGAAIAALDELRARSHS